MRRWWRATIGLRLIMALVVVGLVAVALLIWIGEAR